MLPLSPPTSSDMDEWEVPKEAQKQFTKFGVKNLKQVLQLSYERWKEIPLVPLSRSNLIKGLLKKENMHWLEWAKLSQYKDALPALGASDDMEVLKRIGTRCK